MAKKTTPAGITVDVDLGSTKATKKQIARLRACIESHVITWVRSDLGEKSLPPISIPDHNGPPQRPPSDDE